MAMRVKFKIANAWKTVRRIFIRPGGNYIRVRKMFEKINGAWEIKWHDTRWKIWSMGSDVSIYSYPNCGVYANNNYAGLAFRSYNLLLIDNNGKYQSFAGFDVWGEFSGQVGGEIVRMYDALQSLPNGQLFCLYSIDEPKNGSDGMGLRDLRSAVYRVGGNPANFGANNQYRGAYILLGKVGQASSFEMYYGTQRVNPIDGQPMGAADASIQLSFNVRDGNYTEITVKVA